MKKKFLALDTETGDLHDKGIVTLGLAVFEDDQVVMSKEWLLKPMRFANGNLRFRYTEAAEKIHGISLQEMTTKGIEALVAYKEVREFLGGVWSYPIVSHNAAFDSDAWGNFIHALSRYDSASRASIPRQEILTGPWICTRRVAQGVAGIVPAKVKNLRLETLCNHFGLGDQGEIHGAEWDAILAGRLYLALREDMRRKSTVFVGDCDHTKNEGVA